MISRIIFLAWIYLCSSVFTSFSQRMPVYKFQEDDTLLKRKYFDAALQKKALLLNSLNKEKSKNYKEAYEDMFEVVKDLLLSTRSVTEEKADNYIKAVASKIISSNPELKGLDTRIIFTRDFSPNAYSIGDGTIAFNAGLFIYLNNEAEMAFVLGHELAHYYLDHSKKRIDKLVYLINSDSLKKELKRLSKQEYRIGEELDKIIKSLAFDIKRHSREGEEEADRVGVRFLRNSGYHGNGFITSMQILDKIDDTAMFSSLNLQKILSFPDYPFRERWIKKESAIFSGLNPEEASGLSAKERDSLKTHPNCTRRISLLESSVMNISGKEFQVDEQLFNQLKRDLIPEIIEEVFRSGNISLNLYLCLEMLQEGKHMPLAAFSIARDLNLIYKHQKEHQLGLIIDTENRRFNESYNLLLRMIYKLRLSEIADLNTSFCTYYMDQMKNYDGFEKEFQKAKQNKLAHQ